jgi:hypothetical protein
LLAERLPEVLLDRALTAAEAIEYAHAKAQALGSLAERLPEARRTEVMDAFLRTLSDGYAPQVPLTK